MEPVLTSVAATGLGVAFVHAAVPTHWLPFALAARVQCWTRRKTLAITALAGGAHVVATVLLGLLVVWAGTALHERFDQWFPAFAGGAILLCGMFYCYRQFYDSYRARSCERNAVSLGKKAVFPKGAVNAAPPSQSVTISGLVVLLFFSPCEAFLPIYLSVAGHGWIGFALLSGTLAGATIFGMLVFTWLTIIGMEKVRFESVERYEKGLTGALLSILGLIVIFLHH